MTGRMPEYMSDEMSENMSDRMPDRLPDRMPGGMSGYMPDRMPEYMPEYMSDRMSEYTKYMSKYTSWHVMVGITRSRVIFFPKLFFPPFFQHSSHGASPMISHDLPDPDQGTDGTWTSNTRSPSEKLLPSGSARLRSPMMLTETRHGFPGGFLCKTTEIRKLKTFLKTQIFLSGTDAAWCLHFTEIEVA